MEGHGEVEAATNLAARLSERIGFHLAWSQARRWKNLHQFRNSHSGGLEGGAEVIRTKNDAAALLILRDDDDGCPRDIAPQNAALLKELNLPFPVAYVLLKPEFEVLFLPCLEKMNLPAWDRESWEARRGVKEWLSGQMPPGRLYKPTVDQLPMTRQIDLGVLRAADVPCFGSLERGLEFLKRNGDTCGCVYPADH